MSVFDRNRVSHSFDPQKQLIVLLQGPVGPFFRELQQHFIASGFAVLKINFNGGDLFFSPRSNVLNFVGSPSEWSTWLEVLITQHRPAAFVLFGDSRPYHVEALRLAADKNVAAWCLEEGYLRPDYITCERGGNNAASPLRQKAADDGPRHAKCTEVAIKNSFLAMATYAASYFVAQAALSALFASNARHRQRAIAAECSRWAQNALRKITFHHANQTIFRSIITHQLRDYYVVALQVHDDLNLLRNGNGWTMNRLIEETTRSFSYYAPRTHTLLFKVHPLDRGHRPYRELIAKAARNYGCESRILIVDDGPIGPMIRHCEGAITVNSTSGLLALRQNIPLLTLGDAVYSTSKLKTLPPTRSAELHTFWCRPERADKHEVEAFVERMRSESLINGSFYRAPFRSATALAVADRIRGEIAELLHVAARAHELSSDRDEIVDERLAG